MKDLRQLIYEKLHLNSKTPVIDPIYIIDDDKYNVHLTINLPLEFTFPKINETATIVKIEEGINSFNERNWTFYEQGKNDELNKVVSLSVMGVKNVFIKRAANAMPLVTYINGRKVDSRLNIAVANIKDPISEKLHLGASIENQNQIYWFTNNLGIITPFIIRLLGNKGSIDASISTIDKIQHNKDIKVWAFYDDNDRHVVNAYIRSGNRNVSTIDALFKYDSHRAVLQVFDKYYKNAIGQDTALVAYKDSNGNVVSESMNNFITDSKTYSNMILLSPDEDSVLILRRANYMKRFHGMYGFPGGAVDAKDKDAKYAAIRELKEETGIELTWNEEHNCKKYDTIKNKDGSISEYYITTLESMPETIKISKEHAGYEWFNSDSKKNHNWMPDVFQIIQKIL